MYRKNHLLTIISSTCTLILAQSVNAAGAPVTHQFVGGLPALAQQVNGNFQELANRIQTNTDNININATNISNNTTAINAGITVLNQHSTTLTEHTNALAALAAPVTYDFHNYGAAANVLSTHLRIRGNGLAAGDCVNETRQNTRTSLGNGITNVDTSRIRTTSTGTNCGNVTFHFQSRPDGYYLMSQDTFSGAGVLTSSIVLADPVITRTANMIIGRSFGHATATTTTSANPTVVGSLIENSVLQGVENVTVPYNGGTTYNNCLKIHLARFSSNGLGGNLQQTSWYCSGIGLTKRIDSAGNIWELNDVTLAP